MIENLRNEMFERIDVAYKYVREKLFSGGMPFGVHSLSLAVIKELIEHIGVKKCDTFWEIGCGEPFLSFSLSAAAEGGMVLATDVGKYCKFDCSLMFMIF
jgi:hypothetical protein